MLLNCLLNESVCTSTSSMRLAHHTLQCWASDLFLFRKLVGEKQNLLNSLFFHFKSICFRFKSSIAFCFYLLVCKVIVMSSASTFSPGFFLASYICLWLFFFNSALMIFRTLFKMGVKERKSSKTLPFSHFYRQRI